MSSKRRRTAFWAVLLALNVCFIWGNSLLPGDISGAISDWVKRVLEALLPLSASEESGGGFLRKLAHFTEFTALGICLAVLFVRLGQKKYWAIPCGCLVACVDETIQRFVPDRGPSLKDVGIDTCGVLTGLILLSIGCYVWKKFKFKENTK